MSAGSGYALLDFGDRQRLERWGEHTLIRPDSRAEGPSGRPADAWARADARFEGRVGGGRWERARPLPERWPVDHDGLRFTVPGHEYGQKWEAVISTAEYPTPARRPANSVLSSARLQATFGVAIADWRRGLEEAVSALPGG